MPAFSPSGYTGDIKISATATVPDGWLACDGSSISRVTYARLFDKIGTSYGSDTPTTFNLPDYRGRAPIGSGAGPSLSTRTIGQSMGAETHTLTIGQLPSHDHVQQWNQLDFGADLRPTVEAMQGQAPVNISSGFTGGNQAHNNMQPSLVSSIIIKY
jgi:microcystin-dependent protein